MGAPNPSLKRWVIDVPPLSLRQAVLLKSLINKEARANGEEDAPEAEIEVC